MFFVFLMKLWNHRRITGDGFRVIAIIRSPKSAWPSQAYQEVAQPRPFRDPVAHGHRGVPILVACFNGCVARCKSCVSGTEFESWFAIFTMVTTTAMTRGRFGEDSAVSMKWICKWGALITLGRGSATFKR